MSTADRSRHADNRPAPHNALRFSCGPEPAAAQMNLFLWWHARQLQAPGYAAPSHMAFVPAQVRSLPTGIVLVKDDQDPADP